MDRDTEITALNAQLRQARSEVENLRKTVSNLAAIASTLFVALVIVLLWVTA